MPLQATSGAASYDAFGGGVAAVPQYIEDVFSTYLYTGNGTSLTVTNNIDLSTKGGLVWLKSRSTAGTHHTLFDSARGANKFLFTDLTDAQTTDSGQTLNTTGFTIGNNSDINTSAATYASWTFRKQPKFFDVVTYTGNGTAGRQIAHSLGSVPGCIIIKCTSTTDNWIVYHRSIGNTKQLTLNTTDAQAGSAAWNTTDPTSTVFTVGLSGTINGSGRTYVAYLFAHNAGGFGLTGTDNVISCGSYTGTGAINSINLGYEVQYVLTKCTSNTGNWIVTDVMRGMWDAGNRQLYPNTSGSEPAGSSYNLYPNATGFTIAAANADQNTNGATYIYIAIRRGPMKVPTSGTSVFSPVTYAGTGSAATTTTGFVTDLAIIKSRGTYSPSFEDRLRGANKVLESSSTGAEVTTTQYVLGFDTQSGVRIGTDAGVNASGTNYIDWAFRRAPSFFDVVCWTSTGSTFAVNHNLNAVPQLIISKWRDGAQEMRVFFNETSTGSDLARLNSDAAATFYSYGANWGGQSTSTTITPLGASAGRNYVAYLFATCAGVSKVFSYTGNGSSQTINCGFTAGARWVLIKRTDSTGDWYVWDSARGIVSGNDPHLSLNTTAAEVTTDDTIDTDSTGFVVNQVSATNVNVSSATYIGIAIA